jgi:hypothetical protein
MLTLVCMFANIDLMTNKTRRNSLYYKLDVKEKMHIWNIDFLCLACSHARPWKKPMIEQQMQKDEKQ